MPRVARIVIPDCPHHITQRGNNRQDVFFVPDDYALYLRILREQANRYGLDVHAYCLMTNHIHLVATPLTETSLAKAVGRTHWLYTQTVNRLHGRSGHLWQNRFYSCALDRRHFWAAVRYVERNPLRANLHRKAWLYPWSSAAAHCNRKTGTGTSGASRASKDVPVTLSGQGDSAGLLDLRRWRKTMGGEEWEAELMRPDKTDEVSALQAGTANGRPLGTDSFLSKVEKALGRRVRPLPVGRPCKRTKEREEIGDCP